MTEILTFEQWKEKQQRPFLDSAGIWYSLYGYADKEISNLSPTAAPVDIKAREEAERLCNLGPEEYAKALLAMPVESALKILNHTSPICLSSLSYLHRIQDPKTPLVSLMRMIYAIETYELNYLKNIVDKITITEKSPLIDVWANYESFILQSVSEEEEKIGKIYFGEKPQRVPKSPNVHSVASEEVFKKNFSIFTERQFEGWQEWDNMVVIGGSIVASLLPVPIDNVAEYYHEIAYPTSDIDVYFYGLTSAEIAAKVGRLYEHLKKVNGGDILVVRTNLTITFCSAWPKRHIQIVIGTWDSIPAIIFEPDIDCTCVVYNGKNLYATERSRFSFNHRAIIASEKRYSTRGSPEYEKRLLKYSQRGFCTLSFLTLTLSL